MNNLPTELWIEIFSYLTASDLINFCEVYEDLRYLLHERSIVKSFDISGNYKFTFIDVNRFLLEYVNYDLIRSLNINNVYWLSLNELRSLLKKLPKLEALYALDTGLSIREKDVKLYENLRTLALSVSTGHCDIDPKYIKNHMYLLRKFCLKVISRSNSVASLYRIFRELVALQELWIEDVDDRPSELINYDTIIYKVQFISKLVIKSKVNIPFLDYKIFALAKVFETRRFKSIVVVYVKCPFEKIIPIKNISLFEPFETEVEAAWDVMRKFQCEMPFDVKSSQEIYMKRDIKQVNFRELNFCHNKCFCNKSFIEATWKFLKSPNSKYLSKLGIKSCALQRQHTSKEHNVENLVKNYPFKDVVENCRNIIELELISCASCNVSIVDGYGFISQFERLRSITLEVPVFVKGEFLIDLVKNCKNLATMKIVSCGTNTTLNKNICKAVTISDSLIDVSIDNQRLCLRDFIEALTENSAQKFRRIYVNCYSEGACTPYVLDNFLQKHKQVMFLFISINTISKKVRNKLQDILNEHKKDNYVKYYLIQNSKNYLEPPVPHREFISSDTNISTVKFQDFR
ncbi:uncharacterized protein LOC143189979 isoform X2 [Rhynchophorus ferrugineus]|uniref:uncharacterized protein LOC143189979 isoform X2 n=1 Tax=Rhynchophorus ferrugineus TaxID=354439 RepID=UPI003FCE7AAC